FMPMLFFGLRAREPCFLFRECLEERWLRVPCLPDLGYRTKGGRDKRFPLLDGLQPLWDLLRAGGGHGLLYLRRRVLAGEEPAPRRGASLAELTVEFQRRCAAGKVSGAAGRQRLRDAVLHEAGDLSYDHIQGEFASLARRLAWPVRATL